MIKGVLDLFFNLIVSLLDLLPAADFSCIFDSVALDFFKNIISFMLFFFPQDLFIAIITSVLFWVGIQFVWAVIEFIIKKFMLS